MGLRRLRVSRLTPRQGGGNDRVSFVEIGTELGTELGLVRKKAFDFNTWLHISTETASAHSRHRARNKAFRIHRLARNLAGDNLRQNHVTTIKETHQAESD